MDKIKRKLAESKGGPVPILLTTEEFLGLFKGQSSDELNSLLANKFTMQLVTASFKNHTMVVFRPKELVQ